MATRSLSMDEVKEALDWDARRRELLLIRHKLRRAIQIEVHVWGLAHTIYRDDAPKVFADIDARLETETYVLERQITERGLTPSTWEPPADTNGNEAPEGGA